VVAANSPAATVEEDDDPYAHDGVDLPRHVVVRINGAPCITSAIVFIFKFIGVHC